MKYLQEIANVVATKKEDTEIHKITQAHKAEIEKETTDLSDKGVKEILAHLFPEGIPIHANFYDSLREFQHQLGYGPAFYKLGGRIWAVAFNEIAEEEKETLLDLLLKDVWKAIF